MRADTFCTSVETFVPEDTFIYSQTDLKGRITEANKAFADLSGYTVDELIGKPHSIVRHPDMPKAAFADLWKSLHAGRPWRGLVKNRRKDGGFYWVVANASPVRENGEIIGYQSLRGRPTREQIQAADAAYKLIQSGNRSLYVEEGRAYPRLSSFARFASRPDMQIAVAALAAPFAAGCALLSMFTPGAYLRLLAFACLALAIVTALRVLLFTLPSLRRDLGEIESFLDSILSTGDLTTPFNLERQARSGRIAAKLALMIS